MQELRRGMIVYRRFFQARSKPRRIAAELTGGIGLYYWDETENLGDYLSYVICDHMISGKVSKARQTDGVLYAIGSILGFIRQDATVWGSGILSDDWAYRLYIKHSALDIRAVRGPNTAKVLRSFGVDCPTVYGDPAILMPHVYQPACAEKKYACTFIPHLSDHTEIPPDSGIHRIDIRTRDYQRVIDEIAGSEKVISSSLHGVILAETYGVPAILLLHDYQNAFKYEDWYLSTGRDCVYARSLEEAMSMEPLPLPELSGLQKGLLDAFPWDLWNGQA